MSGKRTSLPLVRQVPVGASTGDLGTNRPSNPS